MYMAGGAQGTMSLAKATVVKLHKQDLGKGQKTEEGSTAKSIVLLIELTIITFTTQQDENL